jgi:hypothetical protein
MSYSTIAEIAYDSALFNRCVAAAAEETKTKPYESWVSDHRWDLASSPGWAPAWESAVAAGNPSPGNDPSVITDEMILAAVQPMP